jgi:ABC-type Zn uptake system ZnuABC Zn-binding protein ZnuA
MIRKCLLVAVVALVAGCQGGGVRTGAEVRVLTTFQPLYSMARLVAGESTRLTVVNLAHANIGPHEFRLSDASRAVQDEVRSADAIVTLGDLRLSDSFDVLFDDARNLNIRIVEIDLSKPRDVSAPGIPLLRNPEDTLGGDPVDEPVTRLNANPHIWLSPDNAVWMIRRLEEDFSRLVPQDSAIFKANAAEWIQAVRLSSASIQEELAERADLRVVSFTEGFPYLTSYAGVEVVDYILTDYPAGVITDRIRAQQVKVALFEEEPDDALATAVQAGGAMVLVLDTIEHGTFGAKGGLDVDHYADQLFENLQRLNQALKDAEVIRK